MLFSYGAFKVSLLSYCGMAKNLKQLYNLVG